MPRNKSYSPSHSHTNYRFIRFIFSIIRSLWNTVTSMRVALLLLFLLALSAIPGAFFPQHQLNEAQTQTYITRHGALGRIMDKLQLFSVFSSYWFTSIYVLLFISLIGCIIPRFIQQWKSWRRPLPPVPKYLAKLPYHTQLIFPHDSFDTIVSSITSRLRPVSPLRRWRMRTHSYRDAYGNYVQEISAEKGFSREIGNLIFHIGLVMLLVSIALGKLYSYSGIRLIITGESVCTSSPISFDSFRAGSWVDTTRLRSLCVHVDDFSAQYLPSGQADQFISHIHYHDPNQKSLPEKAYTLRVNHPLRVQGQRVYLLGHGFAPTLTVTFPSGISRTQTIEFQPQDSRFFLSEGAFRFDPPAGIYPDEKTRRHHQIGIEGLFAPTAAWQGNLLYSSFPAPHNPAVALAIYEGDTGMDSGQSQNIYSLDHRFIDSGQLVKKARSHLFLGQKVTLANGVTIAFPGYQQWIAIQVSYDPTQQWVAISALLITFGLIASIMIKRQRMWWRIFYDPVSGKVMVDCAGIPKTDSSAWEKTFITRVSKFRPTSVSVCENSTFSTNEHPHDA